jgi:REP element-mobilizing transposase RayT
MPDPRKQTVTWLPGHYYHIYNRGARQKTIFPDKESYFFALRRIQEYSQRLAITVIAYCLLPNHYHFLVRQDGEAPAGLLPQRVFNSYTKAYNQQFQASGTLFERRYAAIQVLRDEYLRHLCFYIHSNPVKHTLVEEIEAWPYSNYLEWIGARRGKLVNHQFVVNYFRDGTEYAIAMKEYIRARGFLAEDVKHLPL